MDLIHKLTYNGTTATIQEPIGFDDLKTKISRGDYHGISLEVSVGDLEFYGAAYNFIKAAYEADIDSKVLYSVEYTDGSILYSGTIDLSTYSEKCGDYCSITCKVGDIGAKTTFNNRTDTEVDLNAAKTIDGADLGMQASWESIRIPMKHLIYTNLWGFTSDKTYTKKSSDIDLSFNAGYNEESFTLAYKLIASEFGSANTGGIKFITEAQKTDNPIYSLPSDDVDDFTDKFGQDTTYRLSGKIMLRIDFLERPTYTSAGDRIICTLEVYRGAASGETGCTILASNSKVFTKGSAWSYGEIELTIPDGIDVDASLPLYVRLIMKIDTPEEEAEPYIFDDARFSITMKAGTRIKIAMYDNLQDAGVYADMLPVHNALNVVAGAISENELSVKSDWYGGILSSWNKPSAIGGGHLKAITNGYKIRGLFTEGEEERNMPISFKELITSLSSIDCIGWGFSKENGADFVRVERWDWFYKDSTILTLAGANEANKSVNTDRIKTELQIGFKKYETASTFNSIDSVHGERTLTNAIKVLSSKSSQLSSLIGDTYCIEETRRAKEQVDPSESFKYDENIFIFELGYKGNKAIGSSNSAAPYIPNNLSASSGVGRPLEQYNIQLSPRRCAERWRSFLFASSNQTPFRFTSGKINYKAAFTCKQSASTTTAYNEYLQDFAAGASLSEDADLAYTQTKFKAEKIAVKYPISLDQYKAIIANPYGLISIDGIEGWIQEMQYTFATGEAEFTLIPKA